MAGKCKHCIQHCCNAISKFLLTFNAGRHSAHTLQLMKSIVYVLILVVLTACSTGRKPVDADSNFAVRSDTLKLYDSARQREIPLAVYQPVTDKKRRYQQVVVFSHGYGENKGGDYLAYSYLTAFLASKGYFVVSIQHELATDSLLPVTGIPQVVRRPFWERGADNILFVINELQKSFPGIRFGDITLIGHSNGGDMTALFPQKYPGIVSKIITLDNRRMALPRTNHPKVYSLRSSDQPADATVLPTAEEQKKFGMIIIQLANTRHNDMDDHANEEQRREIRTYIMRFLNE